MQKINYYFITLIIGLFLFSCTTDTKPPQKVIVEKTDTVKSVAKFDAPVWAVNANIYEVNIRQYTPDGTFEAFEAHLDRLHAMGVNILWLMPIHPISDKNRKGTLGSYYAVQDYKAVNPDFGSLDNFKTLVERAHDLGIKVVVDWVANHTGWDNVWMDSNPDWYTKDESGVIIAPAGTDWSDVADLNYDNKDMRAAMIDAMKYWVVEADIDGFRCDVAGMVPIDFWVEARTEIEKIKPMFMLAEDDKPEIYQAFDVSYGWEMHHIMNMVAKGEKNCNDIEAQFSKIKTTFKPENCIMNFTSNHDENSWNGTAIERLGKGFQAFAVLAATIPGMPLIYSGQEVSLNKRIEFFEKDPINWKAGKDISSFYEKLLKLKTQNKALWNGVDGGELVRVKTNADDIVFAFIREKENERVFVVLNLSGNDLEIEFVDKSFKGIYTEIFTGEDFSLTNDEKMAVQAWGYRVFSK